MPLLLSLNFVKPARESILAAMIDYFERKKGGKNCGALMYLDNSCPLFNKEMGRDVALFQ